MKKLLPLAAAALTLMGAAPVASAATQFGEYFSLTGFGTLGAVRTDTDEGRFGRDRQIGAADKTPALDVDSNLGVQLTGKATSWLSGTVQVLSAKRDKSNIETRFEWAFVTLKPIDDLTVRAGRMAAPMFAVSDSRNVGYANTWVRAPNEVYALNVFRDMEAADVTYSKSLGPVVLSANGFIGKTSFPIQSYTANGKNLKGVNLQMETDWGTLRYGRANAKVTVPEIGLDDIYTFSGFGYTLDRDNFVAQAEYVKRESTKVPAIDSNAWYVLGGYRLGKVLPYAIFSTLRPDAVNTAGAKQQTTALGVRWDAFRSAALKFQVDRIDTHDTQGISFTTPVLPSTMPGPPVSEPITKPVIAVSIALDFTF